MKSQGFARIMKLPRLALSITACPKQEGPRITRAERRAQSHWRAERGTSCYQSGRCRLPNAYLYDKEIIPRVKKAILADGRFPDTNIWIEGQRRWVWLKGCVASQEQVMAIEQLVRNIDDVEAVINQLTVITPVEREFRETQAHERNPCHGTP